MAKFKVSSKNNSVEVFVKCDKNEQVNVQMMNWLAANPIEGFVTPVFDKKGDKITATFSVGGVYTLKDYMKLAMSKQHLYVLLSSITKTMSSLGNNYLEYINVLLGMDTVLVQAATGKALFLYLPVVGYNNDKFFGSFLGEIIKAYKVPKGDNGSYLNPLKDLLAHPERFSWDEIKRCVDAINAPVQAVPQPQMQVQMPQAQMQMPQTPVQMPQPQMQVQMPQPQVQMPQPPVQMPQPQMQMPQAQIQMPQAQVEAPVEPQPEVVEAAEVVTEEVPVEPQSEVVEVVTEEAPAEPQSEVVEVAVEATPVESQPEVVEAAVEEAPVEPQPEVVEAAVEETPVEPQPQQVLAGEAAPRICQVCGSQNIPDALFCTNCGNKLVIQEKSVTNILAEAVGDIMEEEASEGETVFLADASEEATTFLAKPVEKPKVYPYLIKTNDNEKIVINKSRFSIGKSKFDNDYIVVGNTNVSRNHVEIICEDDRYYIVDKESTNRTYVNGMVIESNRPIELVNGTTIMLANEGFTYYMD